MYLSDSCLNNKSYNDIRIARTSLGSFTLIFTLFTSITQ